jgi:predicted GH43/DUF377 family glycosyl hydrolase
VKNLKLPSPPQIHRADIGSFTAQGFKAGLFDFGRARLPNTDYFNCGIIERHDGWWLVTRRARFTIKDKMGMNDIMAFKLNHLKPAYGVRVNLGTRYEMEHYEDPRVFYLNGKLHVSCCTFVRNRRGCHYPHQIICEVDDQWNLVRRYDPVVGHNRGDTGLNTRHEKNWTYFWHDGKPHLLYQPPWVYELAADFKPVIQTRHMAEDTWGSHWTQGQIRGGTPPVLVGDEYWTFFHSSTPWRYDRRQYHMGAYAFEATPPFRVTRVTLEPLLSGSERDGGTPGKPPCIFPCGAIHQGLSWLVTFGVNDHACGWAEIPTVDLLKRCVTL